MCSKSRWKVINNNMSLIFLPPKTNYFHRCPLSISLSGKLNSWREATQICRKEACIILFLEKGGKALYRYILTHQKQPTAHRSHHHWTELTHYKYKDMQIHISSEAHTRPRPGFMGGQPVWSEPMFGLMFLAPSWNSKFVNKRAHFPFYSRLHKFWWSSEPGSTV